MTASCLVSGLSDGPELSYPSPTVQGMEREAQFGVALAVAVVDHPRDRAPGSPRLSEVLDPGWLDDAACASEMQAVAVMRARLDAYEIGVVARLADLRPDFWQDADDPGRSADGWTAQREFGGVSEFFVDEVALVLGISRTRAHTVANTALVLVHQLPATWHALADGLIDLPRARALVAVLGWQQPGVSSEVVAAVEAEALAWAISGEGPYRLQNRTAALLLEHDAAAADRARKEAARTTDVTLQGRRDGLTDLTITLEPDVAAACRDATDRYARMWKADGDDRPIGQLRTLVAADLLLRAWDTSRPPVTAHITIHAPLPSLRPPGCGTGGTTRAHAGSATWRRRRTVRHRRRQPVTSAHLRELLRRWTDAGLDGLHAPDGGSSTSRSPIPTPASCARSSPSPSSAAPPGGRACSTRRHRHPRPRAARRSSRRRRAPTRPPPTRRASTWARAHHPSGAVRGDRPATTHHATARRPLSAASSPPATGAAATRDAVVPPSGPTSTTSPPTTAAARPDCANLCTLCRRHHRLKTHAPGWRFAMTADGMLSVTTPSGITRTTRRPAPVTASPAWSSSCTPTTSPRSSTSCRRARHRTPRTTHRPSDPARARLSPGAGRGPGGRRPARPGCGRSAAACAARC